jgi:hypothetical protein
MRVRVRVRVCACEVGVGAVEGRGQALFARDVHACTDVCVCVGGWGVGGGAHERSAMPSPTAHLRGPGARTCSKGISVPRHDAVVLKQGEVGSTARTHARSRAGCGSGGGDGAATPQPRLPPGFTHPPRTRRAASREAAPSLRRPLHLPPLPPLSPLPPPRVTHSSPGRPAPRRRPRTSTAG